MTIPCLASSAASAREAEALRERYWRWMDEPEGRGVAPGLPAVVDAHVHLFPDRLFEAIWSWFDTHAWPIRYRFTSEETLRFLFAKGVSHIVGLCYAHKPGIARGLNSYMANLCQSHSRLTGLGTVHPEDDDVYEVANEAFQLGLAGIKLHCHVQVMEPNDPRLDPLYAACCDHDKGVVIHAGRQPRSEAYKRDPFDICDISRVRDILKRFPKLRLCVPHLGSDEESEYIELGVKHDNLWLDTTMMLADFFPEARRELVRNFRTDRLMYGTDFPNLPYAWDRELRWLAEMGLSEEELRGVLGENARQFFQIAAEP